MIERPDEEHLTFATEQGRAIYTFNIGDFCRLHARRPTHSGIIVAQQQRFSVGEQMRRLLSLIYDVRADEMRGRLNS